MNPLSVSAIGPATLSALSALRPVQTVAIPAPRGSAADATTLTAQELVQTLFQRTLQAATLFPMIEPASGSAGLVAEASTSLLAALNAPQAAANASTTPDATTNPSVVQTSESSTAPPATPPTPLPGELPATQDASLTSASAEFAMGTALRFGAGVMAQVAPNPLTATLGTGLVRDAAVVPSLGNLQGHGGGPGPEAFVHSQTQGHRNLRSYEVAPTPQGAGQIDLLA
jgi:hypothetical protein